MNKKSLLLIVLLCCFFFVTGCTEKENKTTDPVVNPDGTVNITDESVLKCTRKAEAMDGVTADLSYQVYYIGSYVTTVHSIEKVTSDDTTVLAEYETAYRKAFSVYDGLDHFKNTISKNGNSVMSETIIDYENIDTDKLLEIEGEEDNVIKNGRVKLSDWQAFAKKLGVTCK